MRKRKTVFIFIGFYSDQQESLGERLGTPRAYSEPSHRKREFVNHFFIA
jgi:hypothetical protein